MTDFSRREFTAIAVSAVAVPFGLQQALGAQTSTAVPTAAAAAVTVEALIDRIKGHIGVEWMSETVDGIKAGEPSTTIRGVVTTSLPTLSVLPQAVKSGANVIISSQPAFYSKADARVPPIIRPLVHGAAPGAPPPPEPPASPPPSDPVFTAKNDLIARNNLVIVRLSDHWRRRQPDPLAQGLARALGWTKFQSVADPRRFDMPETTLAALVDAVKRDLRLRGGIRVVGDPKMRVTRAGLLPGSTPIQATVTMMPDVDVVLAGEVREWESVEFARDKAASSDRKALILVGRIVSEDPGMQACADWLRTFVPEVPITHITAGDPYWRPAR